jgi:Sulfatase
LSAMGFTVAKNPSANYTQTPCSMASLLSMSYFDELKNFDYSDKSLNFCYKNISHSKVVSGFSSLGYEFVNYSIFDFKNKTSLIKKTFLKSGTALITSQTLWSRVKKDLYYNFLMNHFRHTFLYRDFIFADLKNNKLLYKKTIEQSAIKASVPRFIYTHLLMPHFPYYYNVKGQLNDITSIGPENIGDDSLYLEYLQYTNGKVLNLLSEIIRSNSKAIVILLSDHGYRYTKDRSESLSNLSAIYDPERKIPDYYQEISNINIFRVVFNDLFHAGLPLLNDRHF